jgi:TRAP-type C4-dicarboxylate transport system substrate-binding protein
MIKPSYSVAAALVAASLAVSVARAETITVTNGLAATHVVSAHGIDPWMACVKQGTKDAVSFNYFPGGQLVTVKNALDSLNKGLSQVAFVSASNEPDKIPLAGVAMLPNMGETATEMVTAWRKVLDTNGVLMAEMTANKIKPLLLNILPPYQVMSTTPMDSLEKFKGKKIRAAGGALTFIVSSLGASAVEMPAGDMYLAMQRGTVDGTILAMSSVKSYNIQELAKAMSSNGSFGTSAQMFAMNLATWNKLPQDQQRVMDQCGRKVELDLARLLDEQDVQLKAEFAAKGVNVFKFSDAAKGPINEHLAGVAKDYVTRLKARGLPVQEALDSYSKALGK